MRSRTAKSSSNVHSWIFLFICDDGEFGFLVKKALNRNMKLESQCKRSNALFSFRLQFQSALWNFLDVVWGDSSRFSLWHYSDSRTMRRFSNSVTSKALTRNFIRTTSCSAFTAILNPSGFCFVECSLIQSYSCAWLTRTLWKLFSLTLVDDSLVSCVRKLFQSWFLEFASCCKQEAIDSVPT